MSTLLCKKGWESQEVHISDHDYIIKEFAGDHHLMLDSDAKTTLSGRTTLKGAGCSTRDIMKKAVVARDIFDMEDSNTCDKVRALSNIAK